jgi:hypothetical protein
MVKHRKKKNMRKLQLVVMMSGLLMVAPWATANLIVNGSFEDGNFAPNRDSGTMQLFNGATDITGWTVNGGGGGAGGDVAWELNANQSGGNPWGFYASQGTHFIDLTGYANDGNNPHGGVNLSQTVNTIAGQSYYLSFDVGSSHAYSGSANPVVQVTVNGTPATYIFTGNVSLPDAAGSNNHWQQAGFVFTSTGGPATIDFLATTLGGDNVIDLDNVSLTAVPEPTTIISGALMLLPFGASTLRILRRKVIA